MDITKETKSDYLGLERILVWVYRKQDCQKYDVYGWEVDTELTNQRNGCTFEEARAKHWPEVIEHEKKVIREKEKEKVFIPYDTNFYCTR